MSVFFVDYGTQRALIHWGQWAIRWGAKNFNKVDSDYDRSGLKNPQTLTL